MSAAAKLIADIGGTNARFALARDGRVEHLTVLPTGNYKTIAGRGARVPGEAAARHQGDARRHRHGRAGDRRRGASDQQRLVVLDRRRRAANSAFADLQVFNDFAAAALGIPLLAPSEYVKVGAVRRSRTGRSA